LLSRASACACSSVRFSASASRRFAALIIGSFRWFSRRGDDGGELGPTFFGLADVDDRHPLRLRLQLLEIVGVLRVVDEPVVVADRKSELVLGAVTFGAGAAFCAYGAATVDAHSQHDQRAYLFSMATSVNKNERRIVADLRI